MTFEDWFKKEGVAMLEDGCSHEVIARASWQACKGSAIEIIESNTKNLCSTDIEYIALDNLSDEIETEM